MITVNQNISCMFVEVANLYRCSFTTTLFYYANMGIVSRAIRITTSRGLATIGSYALWFLLSSIFFNRQTQKNGQTTMV